MNKKLLPVVALILSASATSAYAVNGKVNFTGEIIQSTCTVTSTDQNKDVFIGKYPTTAFNAVGDVTASKAFTINTEKCEAGDYSCASTVRPLLVTRTCCPLITRKA